MRLTWLACGTSALLATSLLAQTQTPAKTDQAPPPSGDPRAAAKSPSPKARRYVNPILHADYSDPDVIRAGDRYYMTASTFHFSPGLPVLESRDLVHWTIIGHALPRLPFHTNYDLKGPLGFSDDSDRARFNPAMGHRYGQGVWAPAIRFREAVSTSTSRHRPRGSSWSPRGARKARGTHP